jgi:virginiamycin B lyase
MNRFGSAALLLTLSTLSAILSAQSLTFTDYPLSPLSGATSSITTGPDGALWFTETTPNKIGRVTVAGVVSEYDIPTPNSGLYGITAGPK